MLRQIARPRTIVLLLLWSLPVLFYVGAGALALYQTGWFYYIMWTLPPVWLTAWLIGRLWKPAKLHQTAQRQPLRPAPFWTPRDTAAIQVVENFRSEVADVDANSIADVNRYLADAQELATRLASHYHTQTSQSLLHPLTLVEILTVIHLASEDLEQWVRTSVPASDLATVGQLKQIPGYVNALDVAQKIVFLASAVVNPARLFAYPLWRKSGRVTFELQNELIRLYYQRYLQLLGYYLIEMYSGRLRGGSQQYRARFGPLSAARHASDGDLSILDRDPGVSTTIAVMGQVNAGKSSLINALMKGRVARTGVLPETRAVTRYEYTLPKSPQAAESTEIPFTITLLDTPGYCEADVTAAQQQEIRTATKLADIVILVLAANVSARDADLQAVHGLIDHYRKRPELKPPTIIGVVTHIDLLRPLREWEPPYDWQNPQTAKEKSMAATVAYLREVFGDSIAGYACVYTGDDHPPDHRIAEELVPLLVQHLDQAHAVAILKAFYQQLGQERIKKLARQLVGLLKSVTDVSTDWP
jgi:predicted GTPase